jgi:LacI family transcriptional regulator
VSFDAVFAINDDMACGAIEVLQEEGFKVPEDISVVGFDGAFSENPTNERLTTIAIDYSKISEVLVSKILRLMEGKGAKSELVPVSLRIRQTA